MLPVLSSPAADDGSGLLTSPEVQELLAAAVAHAGGRLLRWRLDHVDANPQHSTTATYSATVEWPTGPREELFGASARVGGRAPTDERAVIFGDGGREVAVWLYPEDPDLPGLRRAAVPSELAALLIEYGVLEPTTQAGDLSLEVVSYRPRRRAVVKVTARTPAGPRTFYVKVLREPAFAATLQRHQLLLAAGVPAPVVAAATPDFVLVLHQLPGRPLARAIFDEAMPCTAGSLLALLDAMPPAVATLERRPPWSEAVGTYAEMISAALPALRGQLDWLAGQIGAGLSDLPFGNEPTHGDFHEGQLFVAGGAITGVLDIDTVGPGRRADDLGCLLAHLGTVQRMSPEQAAGLARLVEIWLRDFDRRVDPRELRLRAAGVVISLATGPYRGQEPDWPAQTVAMVNHAQALVRQAA